MTFSEKGKFCARCEKEVFDFTGFSKFEITQKLKNNKNLCGRFQQNQLDQEYTVSNQTNLSRFGLVFGIGSLLAFCQPAHAQTEKPKMQVVNQQTQDSSEEKSIELSSDSLITVSGTLKDEYDFALAGANVLIKGTLIGSQTDFDGNFSIEIPAITEENPPILVFSNIDTETKTLPITSDEPKNIILNSINNDTETMGVVVCKRPNIFQRFLNLFRKKENRH